MDSRGERELSGDIARIGHWESVWKSTKTIHQFSRYNYYDFRLGRLFESLVRPGARALEIGCGGSRWVSFFDRILHCESWGIDYSPEGLRLAEQHSATLKASVRLVQGDFFDDSLLPSEYFDLLYSFGFVEHFLDVSLVTRRMARILRPGGKVMTLIPNFLSSYGSLQKAFSREIFEKHVVMDGPTLDSHHVAAGLVPLTPADYWGCFAPGVVNFGRLGRFVLPPVKLFQHLVCWVLYGLNWTRESRKTSPYIVGIYAKGEGQPKQ